MNHKNGKTRSAIYLNQHADKKNINYRSKSVMMLNLFNHPNKDKAEDFIASLGLYKDNGIILDIVKTLN